jgi:hypothetical protein
MGGVAPVIQHLCKVVSSNPSPTTTTTNTPGCSPGVGGVRQPEGLCGLFQRSAKPPVGNAVSGEPCQSSRVSPSRSLLSLLLPPGTQKSGPWTGEQAPPPPRLSSAAANQHPGSEALGSPVAASPVVPPLAPAAAPARWLHAGGFCGKLEPPGPCVPERLCPK